MIDINKPIRTKTGQEARILATDLKGEYPIVVAYKDRYATLEIVSQHNMETLQREFKNIPERTSRWLNIYNLERFLVQTLYVTKDAARLGRASYRSCQGFIELVYEGDKFIEAIFHKD